MSIRLRTLLLVIAEVLAAACTPAGPQGSTPSSAADGTCQIRDVSLRTSAGGMQRGIGIELTIAISFPNNMSCVAPEVKAELEDAHMNRLTGVKGSPVTALGGDSCSTNVSLKCMEETYLYWSNWCGPGGTFQIAAIAFEGRLRSSAAIVAPPPCTARHAPSQLGGVTA